MMTIGVIFDLSSVMIFDSDIQLMAWKQLVEELVLKDLSEEDVECHIKRKSAKDILEYFTGYPLSAEMIEQFSDERDRIYRASIENKKIELSPGLKDYLNYLIMLKAPLAITTTDSVENMSFCFEHFGLSKWFKWENCIIAPEYTKAVPDKEMYLAAAAKTEVEKEHIIFFGGNADGIDAAYKAGFGSIIGIFGDNAEDELRGRPGVIMVTKNFETLRSDSELMG